MREEILLRIHSTSSHVTTLGPGPRYVIWTQGCPRRCPGCISPESQPLDGGRSFTAAALAERLLHSGDPALTISGGEPFLQCEGLCAVIDLVRRVRDLGIICYTGYTIEELMAMHREAVDELLKRLDVLIDGPYIEALNDDLGLRGSSNQRAIFLTDRYRNALEDFGRDHARRLEYRIYEDRFYAVGVPTRQNLHMITAEAEGNDAK